MVGECCQTAPRPHTVAQLPWRHLGETLNQAGHHACQHGTRQRGTVSITPQTVGTGRNYIHPHSHHIGFDAKGCRGAKRAEIRSHPGTVHRTHRKHLRHIGRNTEVLRLRQPVVACRVHQQHSARDSYARRPRHGGSFSVQVLQRMTLCTVVKEEISQRSTDNIRAQTVEPFSRHRPVVFLKKSLQQNILRAAKHIRSLGCRPHIHAGRQHRHRGEGVRAVGMGRKDIVLHRPHKIACGNQSALRAHRVEDGCRVHPGKTAVAHANQYTFALIAATMQHLAVQLRDLGKSTTVIVGAVQSVIIKHLQGITQIRDISVRH